MEVIGSADFRVIDVRDLVDKQGNRADTVKEKIDQGVASLRSGQKTIVCCDYGISRSNAVAAGILSIYEGISFSVAVRKVQEATGEKEIKLEPLASVRQALDYLCVNSAGPKRNLLVTGGSGFVGQALLPQLRSKFNVIAPSREELDLERGGTQLDLLVAEQSVGCIIHLASPRVYTSNVALGSTLSMLRNVLDVCVSQDIRLVYPSSWEVFSAYKGTVEADESLPAYPKGPYGDAKYLAEELINLSIQSRGLKCTVLRSSPVYGRGSDKPKFIYNFIDKASRSEKILTHEYKNGSPSLDLMAIEDLVSAIVLAVEQSHLGLFNIGTGVLTSTAEIARLIVDALGSASEVQSVSVDSHVACVSMDHRKANSLLGWHPKTSLVEGLVSLISNDGISNG